MRPGMRTGRGTGVTIEYADHRVLGVLWQIRCPGCGQWVTQFSAKARAGTDRLADHMAGEDLCPLSGQTLAPHLPTPEAGAP
jgi:hypothetical protein